MRRNIFENPNLGLLILALLMLTIIGIRHSSLISNPNKYFIHDTYDGFRTYITSAHHIKHDTSLIHFEGMNYPYGEHIFYPDMQPLLTNVVKFISKITGDLSPYLPAIFNLTLMLAILLCGLMLYLIFRKLDLPDWYAIPAAAAITFLSPQMDRILAHYGLALAFLIPLMIYQLLKFEENASIYKSFLIGLVIILGTLMHSYYFGVLIFLVCFYAGFRFLYTRTWHRFRFHFFTFVDSSWVPTFSHSVLSLWPR